MILDFHTHIYPDHLAQRVVDNMIRMNVSCYCDGTAASLKNSMRRAGITHSVLCNIATKPGQTKKLLDFASATIEQEKDAAHSPCLIPFASVHPFEDGWKDWLQKSKDMGFLGIKLHPDYQDFYIDDPRMEQFYLEIARLGLILVLHAGHDASLPDITHATAERIYNMLPILEQGTTVLAHMGGYCMQEQVYELICDRNVYLDTSYNLCLIDMELAKAIFRKHSPDKILFGTDSPWADQKLAVEYFRDVFAPGFLSETDIGNVLWNNGASLLGLV